MQFTAIQTNSNNKENPFVSTVNEVSEAEKSSAGSNSQGKECVGPVNPFQPHYVIESTKYMLFLH